MNDTGLSNSVTYDEFVLRRLEEPFPLFTKQLPGWTWAVALAIVLALALIYVVFMYIKDARGVGAGWAALLGTLRVLVYAILGAVFLLPAWQTYVRTVTQAKQLLLFDFSASQQTSDDLPSGDPRQVRVTRQELVLDFLTKRHPTFVQGLKDKNPTTAYRFGSKADEEYLLFHGDRVFTRSEREKAPLDAEGKPILPEPGTLPAAYWRAWLTPESKPDFAGLNEADQKRLMKLGEHNGKVIGDKLPAATNIADTLLSVLNKELNSRVQGLVVFTDGRQTEGSTSALRELEARAKAAKVPIFVVGVGEDRLKVKIEIAGLTVPQLIQPEDKFRARAEITGEGLGGQQVDTELTLVHVRAYKAKEKQKDGKVIEVEKEEMLPIEVIERENPMDPKSVRAKVTLGTSLVFKPGAAVAFDKSTPPRAEGEWQLDAQALAAAAKREKELTPDKKWEIGECRDDSEFRLVARVPVDKREGVVLGKDGQPLKFHESNKAVMKVLKKPLRVLMVAAGANRDFQFTQVFLAREVDKKRMELAVHLQLPPGEDKVRTGRVQNVPPDRLLTSFPDTFKAKKDLLDLQSYDVILMYDPDWKQLSNAQIKLLKTWCEQGGGLILVGGHINTVELVRPQEGADADRYQPILSLLPVELADRRDAFVERKNDEPFALDLSEATPEMEFMKLDEELDETKFKEDWQAFFHGVGKERTEKPQRGFFSLYPVEKAKTGALVAARFTDPLTKLKDGTLHPFIVMQPETLPRVVWVGSDQMWRLREYKEAYHERFTTKLVRYAAAKSKGAVARPIRLEMGEAFPQRRHVDVEAKIDGPTGDPLPRDAKVSIFLTPPPGVSVKEIYRDEKAGLKMMPRPGAKDGWFSARFQVHSPGEYELTVKVEKLPGMDTDMTETKKFIVTESNPEMDNTRPDFDLMYRLASEADDVFRRMSPEDAAEVRKALVRPKLGGAEGEAKADIPLDKARLYFNLKNAHLIPTCMKEDKQTSVSRGPHRDMWDDGITLWTPAKAKDSDREPEPVKLSYVLLLVVGLLSAEWLIRKLLRLA